jgi:molybdenum cofactor cytidylyltransferase
MQKDKPASGVSAIVLAAGLSTRMGTVKALVSVSGKPLLERVLSTVRESRADEIVVVLGHSAELIQRSIPFGDSRAVINQSYREGMASSLRIGLSNVSPNAEAALIVLGDQPFLKPQTIDRIIEEYRNNKPEIVIPMYHGFRGNPVLLDRSVFAELAGLTGDMGCRAIFGGHTRGILKIAVEDAGVLVDFDTKEDIERFEQSRAVDVQERKLFESADLSGRQITGPQFVVVGHDAVAKALADLARLLEFRVVLVDPFADAHDAPGVSFLRVLDLSRLPQSDETFAVVASRGQFDEEALEQALNIDAFYIALLANKRRAQEIRVSLREKGIAEEKLAQIHAPAGLDIGAITPAEIALSIMAEAVSKRRKIRQD